MERNFNNDFERFVKENADQYRLYPSSKVWNGIYSSLHTRRKWFGLGIILLLLTGSLVTILMTHSTKPTVILSNKANLQNTETPSETGSSITTRQTTARPTQAIGVTASNQLAVNHVMLPALSNSFNGFGNADFSSPIVAKENGLATNFENLGDVSRNSNIQVTDELYDQDIVNNILPNKNDFSKSIAGSNSFDWTIESVINSYRRKTNRLLLQFNMTPTISYRKLSANKPFIRSGTNASPSSYAPLYDINSAVTHKPDLGLEFGLAAKYALASNFKVRAGLQFNINRYDIKAFNSSFEVASIALRGNRGVDSFYAVSTHRNYSGYKSDWLHNYYFEISLPVGVEVNIMGDDKVQFGVAGTVQPTYILGDRAYLLSTDYKNYALVPWLIRRWNINAGLETFVSYSTGKVKWQVGPQVRYQLLSSFIDKYPVKENLFDFGLKVGVSLTR